MNATAGQTDPSRRRPAGKWILIVGDQPVLRDILERFFQAAGHFVSTAADSREGLAKAHMLPIDLIVLDLDMAGSFALAVKLKNEPATARVPRLLISARLKPHDLAKIPGAEPDLFLSVPFSLADVRRLLKGMREDK
ncbi:MAG TPA: response regulator [Opitutaceae bacterium]|nr:response regulator [Opitutaceae bacterium]